MPRIVASNVRETTAVTSTGAATLLGVRAPGRTFSSVMSVGDTCYYGIFHTTLNEWEIGLGTYSGANTLTRTTVLESSDGNSVVNFSAGTKNVEIVSPAKEVMGPELNVFKNNFNEPVNAVAMTANSMFLFPLPYGMPFPGNMTAETMRIGFTHNLTVTSSYASTLRVGLFVLSNSTQLSLINSASSTWSQSGNANNTQSYNGPRFVNIVSSQWSTTPKMYYGEEYYMGIVVSTAGVNTASFQIISAGRSGVSGFLNSASNTSHKFDFFHGIVGTANIPSSVAHSAVSANNNYGIATPVVMIHQGIQSA